MRLSRSRLFLVAVLFLLGSVGVVAPSADTPARAASTIPDDAFLSAMTGGNTVGAPIREDRPRADGFRHIDTPAMIDRLKALNVTMYTYGIWDLATDWDDLRHEFAPAAEQAGIDIMVYLVPPSECFLNEEKHLDGRCSRPYHEDYIRWGEEIGRIALEHPNVTSWGIDDFLVGQNAELFTTAYLAEVRAAMDAVKPDLKWYVTLYFGQITDEHVAMISDSLDGIIYPYNGYNNNTVDVTWLERRLDAALDTMSPSGLDLVLLVYSGRFLDGIIHPDERYASDVLQQAEPYLSDGRVSGVIAYGAPVDLKLAQQSWDYWAHAGDGRLSLSVSNFTPTSDGSFASASQDVVVPEEDEGRKISFYHHDQDDGGDSGYHTKQLLVDDEVVWEQETVTDPQEEWIHTEVDLSKALQGRTEAIITFRLLDKKGVGWWPLDWSVDDVTATGFTVRNGGFESDQDWTLDRNQPTMQPYIDIFAADRPVRIFNAISEGYARYQGRPFTPVSAPEWPNLRIDRDNRAVQGNGWLAFNVSKDTEIPADTCASAFQDVRVVPGLPRYALSFWHTDPTQGNFGQLFKQLRIDGETLWDRDAGDYWNWFAVNGSDHQGVIDVTEFVQGKDTIRLEFAVCSKKAVTELETTIGFDHLETVGLDVLNAGFENDAGWTVRSKGPIESSVEVAGPCQDPAAEIITGVHAGSVKVSGITCLQDADVKGPVTVQPGGSLHAAGSSIEGRVRSANAHSVILTGTRVRGPVAITGTTGELTIEGAVIRGPLTLTDNKTAAGTTLVQSTHVDGTMTCTGNVPVPSDLGFLNEVAGRVFGDC